MTFVHFDISTGSLSTLGSSWRDIVIKFEDHVNLCSSFLSTSPLIPGDSELVPSTRRAYRSVLMRTMFLQSVKINYTAAVCLSCTC